MTEQDEGLLAKLLAGIGRGSRADFESFYRLTVKKVLGLSRRILGEQQSAEDCAADVFLQVWKGAKDYSLLRGNPSAWLMVMCRTRAIDQLRRVANSARLADAFGADQESLGLAEVTPEMVASAFQAGTRLHDALSGLSRVQHQLIGLAFFKNLSHAEISTHTGLPLGTVKSHIRRGINAIRSSLESDGTRIEDMLHASQATH